MARLLAVNVGTPRDIQWRGETVRTGIWKTPVEGRRMVRRLNIDGDGQGDLAGHGGEQRAVLVYQIASYRYWESELGSSDFSYGQFGENFTVDGLPDDEVCIGDRYRIGGALFEVTQPRVTCYRVGIRMGRPEMPSLLVSHHRPGFYLRVLEEGEVGAGDEIIKVADGPEKITVAEIDALLYLPGRRRDLLERSVRIPALSPGWKSSLQALMDAQEAPGAGNAGLATAGPPPAWTGFRSLRVARVTRETGSVSSFVFQSPDGLPLPLALPGQFVVLKIQPEASRPPILRNYSLSGMPGSGVYRVSVKQESNGVGSTYLDTKIRAGDSIEVSAPRGTFTLAGTVTPVVLLSAGIGATPVLAMLQFLTSVSGPSPDVWWLYGARNRSEHPFADESRALLKELPKSRSCVFYSQPAPGDRLGRDFDESGHLSVAAFDRLGVPRGADFYLCGPSPFLQQVSNDLKTWGVAAHQIHSEVFGPSGSLTPGITRASKPPHAPPGDPGAGPQISFARSSLTVPWSPTFQNLLEFAEACDVPVRWSCRTGVCHNCESGLIGGAVSYHPDPLEPPAEGNVLICCSQPKGDIELDL